MKAHYLLLIVCSLIKKIPHITISHMNTKQLEIDEMIADLKQLI